MLSTARVRALVAERASQLPSWLPEAVEEMADRIEELEGVIVGALDENEEMFAALRFYAGEANGERARAITER